MSQSDLYKRIYAIVRKIPEGKVATYGQIARLAGHPRHARQVGYALYALRAPTDIPWHRVINAKGCISPRRGGDWHITQRILLEKEGVHFNAGGQLRMELFLWTV